MPIINENKTILFIHIPKTGGTSIESAFENLTLFNKYGSKYTEVTPQHFDREIYEYLGITADNSVSFAIVREPKSRFISEYNYRLRASRFIKRLINVDQFAFYIDRRVDKNIRMLDNHINPQSNFIFSTTKVFKFESELECCFQNIASVCNSSLKVNKLPHKKKSEKKITKINSQTASIINHVYKRDFERFDYPPVHGDSNSRITNGYNFFVALFFRPLLYLASKGL